MFANALRTHSRLRVLTATRVALPATKSISSLVAYRTAVPKNVSLSASRSFTTSQVARNESEDVASRAASTDMHSDTVIAANNESEDVATASTELLSDTVIAANNESEDVTTAPSDTVIAANNDVATEPTDALSDTVIAANNESEDVATRAATTDTPSDTVIAANNEFEDVPTGAAPTDAPSDVVPAVFPPNNDSLDGASRAASEKTFDIFIANIPFKSKEHDILKAFSEIDNVIGVNLHVNVRGFSRGTAHVKFASKDEAVAAMKSVTEKPIQMSGRYLRVESAFDRVKEIYEPNDYLYFSGCTSGLSEIRTLFQDFNDSIVDLFLLNLYSGDHSGCGFVRFNSIESATAAMLAVNGTRTAKGEIITVQYAKPRKEDVSNGGNHKPNQRLYVKGCTGDVSEIRTVFQEFSDSIKDVSLLDRPLSGKSFVLFDSIESATAAKKALHGTRTAMGQRLTVEFAKPLAGSATIDKPKQISTKQISIPNEKLFFAGCTGDVSEVRTVFQEFSASIKDVSLLRDGKGFVIFDSTESATAAMQALDGTQTAKGEKILVEYSKPLHKGSVSDKPNERLFFTGCTGSVSEVVTIFQEFGASVKEVNLLNDSKTGGHTGNGFVTFSDIESATAAMQALDGTQTAKGEKITLVYANPKQSNTDSSGRDKRQPNRKLFFSGCTGSVSEVGAIFHEFSTSIHEIHLLNDPHSGDHSGCGFVTFKSIEVATAAMQALNGTQTAEGEKITLEYSDKEKKKWGGSRRFRRGGKNASTSKTL